MRRLLATGLMERVAKRGLHNSRCPRLDCTDLRLIRIQARAWKMALSSPVLLVGCMAPILVGRLSLVGAMDGDVDSQACRAVGKCRTVGEQESGGVLE